ncbi:hypothetical protein BROUX41_005269 [Berkeleyomyces rouxiae]|uniref:uncharacterized protein n=1 Tax=Berkeleyomyces rouxiae TaxID=2035830 RepID=UPI003B77BAD7
MPSAKHQAQGSFSLFPAPHTYTGSPPLSRIHRPSVDTFVTRDSPVGQSPSSGTRAGTRPQIEAAVAPQQPTPVSPEQPPQPEPPLLVPSSSPEELPPPPPPPPPALPFRSSIAKIPLRDHREETLSDASTSLTIRSIFPVYNPDVPLAQQEYFPTQTSPTRIRRSIISRPLYSLPSGSGSHVEEGIPPLPSLVGVGSPTSAESVPVVSPLSSQPETSINALGLSTSQVQPHSNTAEWPPPPRRHAVAVHTPPPPLPKPSPADAVKSLWKVTNGWKATEAEGRVYCLALTKEPDALVYTLSSATQPFYSLKLDPTSASARMTLSRLDVTKASRASSSSAATAVPETSKHWYKAISTVLEEESRLHPPNDGLVALLDPAAAQQMARAKAHDPAALQMAANECARLVWDADSATYYLVHPALAAPFYISIARSGAAAGGTGGGSGRVEYTLEHHEAQQHLARLTRDCVQGGGGCLQLDTGLAAKIDAFFTVDVAVAALMLVAYRDERNLRFSPVFDPPPGAQDGREAAARAIKSPGLPAPVKVRGRMFRRSPEGDEADEPRAGLAGSLRRLVDRQRRRKDRAGARQGSSVKVEEFELDVESQNSWYGQNKHGTRATATQRAVSGESDEKLPWPLRVVVVVFKGMFWVVVVCVKAALVVAKGVTRCLGVKY